MRVLVVDDHLTNRKLMRLQLEAEGNVVFEAANGCDALAVLGSESVDAVISDILMPVMDGFRLCYEIRKSGSAAAGVPLILYTATFDTYSDRKLATTVGADGYLLKPASTPAILAALGEAQLKARHRSQATPARPQDTNILELYNSALVRKLEARNGELQQALGELQIAHEQILEMNQNLETRIGQRTAVSNAVKQDRADAPLELIDVDLNPILEEALVSILRETRERNIQWQLHPLPHVKGDPLLLRQLLTYLIENAVKYSRARDPAVIDIGSRRGRADEQVIWVRDNGMGFDMQQAGWLFGGLPGPAGEAACQDTATGFASAHRVVTRHDGRIWAEAELGRGATFYVSLQRAPSG